MTKIAVTEYETVEVQEQRYECENCSAIVSEDDITTVCYIEGEPKSTARVSDRSVETKHLCNGCSELPHALKVREKKEYLKARWKGVKEAADKSVNYVSPVLFWSFGALSMFFAAVMTDADGETKYILAEPFLGGILAALCLFAGAVALKWVFG